MPQVGELSLSGAGTEVYGLEDGSIDHVDVEASHLVEVGNASGQGTTLSHLPAEEVDYLRSHVQLIAGARLHLLHRGGTDPLEVVCGDLENVPGALYRPRGGAAQSREENRSTLERLLEGVISYDSKSITKVSIEPSAGDRCEVDRLSDLLLPEDRYTESPSSSVVLEEQLGIGEQGLRVLQRGSGSLTQESDFRWIHRNLG